MTLDKRGRIGDPVARANTHRAPITTLHCAQAFRWRSVWSFFLPLT